MRETTLKYPNTPETNPLWVEKKRKRKAKSYQKRLQAKRDKEKGSK